MSTETKGLDEFLVIERGQYNDSRRQLFAPQLAQYREAVHVRHEEVENHNLRPQLAHSLQRFLSGRRASYYFDILLDPKKLNQAVKNDWMVIGQNEANRRIIPARWPMLAARLPGYRAGNRLRVQR